VTGEGTADGRALPAAQVVAGDDLVGGDPAHGDAEDEGRGDQRPLPVRDTRPVDGALGEPAATPASAARLARSCSAVRLKKYWNTEPPQVATTLIRPAPTIVP
jgi:hypothetical protein